MGKPTKRHVTPEMLQLKDLAGPETWKPK
jgi:hypothetical protein